MMNAPAAEAALRYCRRCEADYLESECRAVPAGSGTLLVCPTCGMVTGAVVRRVRRPLKDELIDAVRWPAKGDNRVTWLALGVGVVLFSKVPLVGGMLSLGALCSYVFVVVQRGARGQEEAPPAADFESWWDLALPVMQGVAAMVIPMAPLVGALFLHGAAQWALGILGVLWAVALLPAALASAAYGGSFARALNPLPMFALVGRIPVDYARTVAVLAALSVAWLAAKGVTFGLLRVLHAPLPMLALPLSLILDAAMVYFPLAMARVVAVLLRERAEELGIEPLPGVSAR
ncbi:MAG: hypothetical protein Q8S73_06390 [Deltaproteobacteria bacterium]|nr:hypothetical protein [Myxococcales bacterium]MDP3213713.1 hypothetical protein [Deltaproteobacteria bacterium]